MMRAFMTIITSIMLSLPLYASAQSASKTDPMQLAQLVRYWDNYHKEYRYKEAPNSYYRDRHRGNMGNYVCYNKRILIRGRGGDERARYKGCHRSHQPCASIGKNHFGKYNSNRDTRRALDRCINNSPRFID